MKMVKVFDSTNIKPLDGTKKQLGRFSADKLVSVFSTSSGMTRSRRLPWVLRSYYKHYRIYMDTESHNGPHVSLVYCV